ncbi:hypothetical protein [uncultured Nitrosomonas sp.]|uniref:hypothetical protein n=1 Tax=uncultured Nitrosomonas sp. TaxID=156424 RepID=UPI0025E50A25|nr:hypothetical protein [uncultured Nitrosomonas sp.]
MKRVTTESDIRILKVATCPSLSGKSTLTYQIACNAESDIQFRIVANTGGGFFSKEWITLDTILEAFNERKGDKPIVSLLLYPLFQGKSLNTPAFLLAVLKQEGLVSPLEDNPKHYTQLPSDAFMAEVEKLMQTAIDPTAIDGSKKTKSKKSQTHSAS